MKVSQSTNFQDNQIHIFKIIILSLEAKVANRLNQLLAVFGDQVTFNVTVNNTGNQCLIRYAHL